ncbi:MAG: hypothetical protein AB7T06_10470 [Kofleriaceae bacterium]
MGKLHVDRVVIKLRGISAVDARRAAGQLGPALARALNGTGGRATLAERIATPLADKIRGGKR